MSSGSLSVLLASPWSSLTNLFVPSASRGTGKQRVQGRARRFSLVGKKKRRTVTKRNRMLRCLAPTAGAAAAVAADALPERRARAASLSPPQMAAPRKSSLLARRLMTDDLFEAAGAGKRVRRSPTNYTPEVKRQRVRGPCCEKCDGSHRTDVCPHYVNARGNHPDEERNTPKRRSMSFGRSGGSKIVASGAARAVRQPGDGSCLFHSLAYGHGECGSATATRRAIARYIALNAGTLIADSPLSDWIQWESGMTCAMYARRMGGPGAAWGGGIEMAAFSRLENVNVHVYERTRRSSRRAASSAFKRIGCFDCPGASRTVSVLYGGRVHFDALILAP